MELIIVIVVMIGIFWWFTAADKKAEELSTQALDSSTRKEPDLTTVPDGIGHQSILVSALDVNKDGKVNVKDAVAAVDAVVDNAKAIKAKAETAVKKPRKPRAKKSDPSIDHTE